MAGNLGSGGWLADGLASAELLRALFDEAPEALLVTDAGGRIVASNPRAAALTGRPATALAGCPLAELLAPPGPDPATPRPVEPLGTAGPAAHLLRRVDGQLVDVEVRCRPLPGGLRVWDLRDAGERRRREIDLWIRSEALESSNNGIALASLDGRLFHVNGAFLRMWGLPSAAEAIGRAASSFWDSPAQAQAVLAAVLEQGGGGGELVGVRKNGERFPVDFSASLVRDHAGRPVATMGAFIDTSARSRAVEALRESEERLRQAVRVADIGIFDNDLRGGVVHWSARQREIFDLGPDEPVTMAKMLERVHPEDRQAVRAAIAAAEHPRSDGRYDVDCRVVHRDGAVRYVSVRARTYFEGDGEGRRAIRRVGACRDVTERTLAAAEGERLRAQLEHAQRLESVGRLAGGVAHDFNNMLAVILGNAELIRTRPGLDPEVHADLADLEQAARHARDVARQLLAFSRRQASTPRPLDLNEAVDQARRTLARLIGEDVEIVFGRTPGLWLVSLDPMQVDQILMNLAVNARDAMPGGGRLTIEAANVRLDEAFCRQHAGCRPGDHVLLAVSDTGVGMDQETVRHVFEPFFTTKEPGKGTGLGLAIVYGIVTQSGGALRVYSEPGHGTTFRVYFPRLAPGDAEAREDEAPAGVPGGGTVLLVEDDAMVRRMTAAMLASLGLEVLPCSAPSEALDLAGRPAQVVDLVLTDVVLPEMGASALRDRLHELRPDLPVLYMSGYTPQVISHRGVLHEGERILQKPFTIGELARAVHDALRPPPR